MPVAAPVDFVVAQPPATNLLTGGYLYNRRMVDDAPAGTCAALAAPAGASAPLAALAALDRLPAARVVVLDSLWLASPGAAAVAAVRAAQPAARVVWLLHGLPGMWSAGATGPSAAEREALAAADALVAPGGFLPRLLAAHGVATPAFVCPPGIDAALRQPAEAALRQPAPATPDDPPLILTVANVVRHKGHDVLADALATLAALPWRWHLAGDLATDAAFVAELRARLATDAALAARVSFGGALAPAELVPLYRRAALLALPSRSENAPLVVREAQAAGVPVVASDVGGVAELVADGEDGLLVPPGDAPALAGALRRVLAERPAFAAAARVRGAGLPDWPAAAAGFARVMREIGAGAV